MVEITGNELKDTLIRIIEEVRKNPEYKIGKLYKVAAIFLAVGEIKNEPSLLVLSDYIITAPNKFRNLLSFSYQIAGSPLEEKFSELSRNLNNFFDELKKCSNALSGEIETDRIMESLRKLEDLYATLPSIE